MPGGHHHRACSFPCCCSARSHKQIAVSMPANADGDTEEELAIEIVDHVSPWSSLSRGLQRWNPDAQRSDQRRHHRLAGQVDRRRVGISTARAAPWAITLARQDAPADRLKLADAERALQKGLPGPVPEARDKSATENRGTEIRAHSDTNGYTRSRRPGRQRERGFGGSDYGRPVVG